MGSDISNVQITLSCPEFLFCGGKRWEVWSVWFFTLAKKRETDLNVDKCEIICLKKFNTGRLRIPGTQELSHPTHVVQEL